MESSLSQQSEPSHIHVPRPSRDEGRIAQISRTSDADLEAMLEACRRSPPSADPD